MSVEDYINSNRRIAEAWEVVGIYELYLDGISSKLDIEPKLKVKVLKMLSADSPSYRGVPNLEVTGKGGAGPYRSSALKATAEEALRDAVDSFFAFLSDEAEVQEVEDW